MLIMRCLAFMDRRNTGKTNPSGRVWEHNLNKKKKRSAWSVRLHLPEAVKFNSSLSFTGAFWIVSLEWLSDVTNTWINAFKWRKKKICCRIPLQVLKTVVFTYSL